MQQQIARLEEENVRLQIAESKGVALQEENHRLRDKVRAGNVFRSPGLKSLLGDWT